MLGFIMKFVRVSIYILLWRRMGLNPIMEQTLIVLENFHLGPFGTFKKLNALSILLTRDRSYSKPLPAVIQSWGEI